ncbi:hypothetical protein CRUP_009143 [Coryphaenoides rupestris]|nr:hypothetical protein CRUP_009143 [Coryphaenoides rupestris]
MSCSVYCASQGSCDSNLLTCSNTGLLALALGSDVYLWNSVTQSLEGHASPGPRSPARTHPGGARRPGQAVSSLCWSSDGRVLAIGTRQGHIQLWDVETSSTVGGLRSHLSVVGALSWKQSILSSGSVLGRIHHHDPRAPKALVGAAVQPGSVCSLQWSPSGDDWLASGSKDGYLSIWDGDLAAGTPTKPLQRPRVAMRQPSGVKISSLLWAEEKKALVCGHTDRVLHLALSPGSGSRLFSAGADGCVHLWTLEALETLETPETLESLHLTHSSAAEGIVEEEDLNLQPI